MEINGPVFVVLRTSERKIKDITYDRKSVVGLTSTLEKAWKLIQKDYRLCAYSKEIRFTNSSPWGGVYDGFVTIDFRTSYHIERRTIDLLVD